MLILGTDSDTIAGMKVYNSVDANLTYQNFGSSWLGILRGTSEQIRLTCNGLYNLRATSGRETYHNEERTLATFWTSEKAMRRFFYNQLYLPREMGNHELDSLRKECDSHAQAQIEALSLENEEFMVFEKNFSPTIFGNGTIVAERSDHDMKDAILSNAFSEKDFTKKIDENDN